MSQKTQINRPNVEKETEAEGETRLRDGGLYGRSPERSDIKRTYISGMKPREEKIASTGGEKSENRQLYVKLQDRVLAGVLYSISRDGAGEIFPVYVGRNNIGCEPECDVYLSEETVSPNHAVLLIRMVRDGQGNMIKQISITDYDSDYGTVVDNERLGYEKAELRGGELIQIGAAYQFIFASLDSDLYGLGEVAHFRATPRKNNLELRHQNEMGGALFMTDAIGADEEIYPTSVGEEDENTFYGRTYVKKEDHSVHRTIEGGNF